MEMLRTRPVAVILLALSPMALSPEAVLASGGSFFRFDRKYFAPGEVVTAQTTFSTEVEKSGGTEDGPYFAYLLSSDRWIQPPTIPEDAIAVGNVDIADVGGSVPVARITFTVPEIRPGAYTLTLCNVPCTYATVGDLVGGSLSIVPTKEVALRRELSDRIDGRLAQVRGNLAARIRRAEKAQGALTPRTATQELAARVTQLEERLARLKMELQEEPRAPWAAGWIVLGLVLLISGVLWLRRFRGQSASPVRASGSDRKHQSIPMFSTSPDDVPADERDSDRELESARR
ncbi:MAG TPA: hypothetical protein VFH75_00585 [Actinomycetota bacterium]|nr:hypothetical protein [Actinomycetota bacterium]